MSEPGLFPYNCGRKAALGDFETMALESIALTAAVNGLVGLGVRVFGEMGEVKIDDAFRQLLFNATKKYVQTYSDRHGQLQILGMSNPVDLDSVYTSARMLDTDALRSYESQDALEERFRSSGERRYRQQDCPKREGIEIANERNRLIVLGDPGIGKSTFLRKVGLEALKGQKGGYQHQKIPVFLELKRFTDEELDIKQRIADEFETCDFPNPLAFTEKALKKGQLLILFDGLDEVPKANLDRVIERIQDFVDKYRDNRFIASCRIAAYHSYFKGVSTVAIAEFDDEQIKEFIFNWFSSPLDQDSKTAEHCWELLSQSDHQGSKELAQSPLLLTFLCLVYNKSQSFPSNRAILYERALNILLEEWAAEKRVVRNPIYQGFHADLEKTLLSKIAYEGFVKDQLFFSKAELSQQITEFLGDTLDAPKNLNAAAVLTAIEVQQGILVERTTDVYSFSHLTLQEYLAGKYIVDWDLLDDLVELRINDDRWREIFLLVASLKRGGAITLLRKMQTRAVHLISELSMTEIFEWINTNIETTNLSDVWFLLNISCALASASALGRALALTLGTASALDRASTSALGLAFGLACDNDRALVVSSAGALDRARALPLDFSRDRALALSLARDRARNRDRFFGLGGASVLGSTSVLDSAIALSGTRVLGNTSAAELTLGSILGSAFASTSALIRALGLDCALIDTLIRLNIFSGLDLDPLKQVFQDCNPLDRDGWHSYIEWSTAEWLLALNLKEEVLMALIEDAESMDAYLSISNLIFACRDRASGLSTQDWNELERKMLFLPPESSSNPK